MPIVGNTYRMNPQVARAADQASRQPGAEQNAPSADAGKVSQEDAGFLEMHEECSGCSHFSPPNACQLVAGEIQPESWCKLYEAGGPGSESESEEGEAGAGEPQIVAPTTGPMGG